MFVLSVVCSIGPSIIRKTPTTLHWDFPPPPKNNPTVGGLFDTYILNPLLSSFVPYSHWLFCISLDTTSCSLPLLGGLGFVGMFQTPPNLCLHCQEIMQQLFGFTLLLVQTPKNLHISMYEESCNNFWVYTCLSKHPKICTSPCQEIKQLLVFFAFSSAPISTFGLFCFFKCTHFHISTYQEYNATKNNSLSFINLN